MKKIKMIHQGVLVLALLSAGTLPKVFAYGKLDTAKIEQLTGLKGKLNEKENVFKVSYPRNDLNVMIAGVKATPRSEEHTSELQSLRHLVCRLLLEKKKNFDKVQAGK